jgi:pimeloyl-ACP methyl ester carboxylesterase
MFYKDFRFVFIFIFACFVNIFSQNTDQNKNSVPRFENAECVVPIPKTETKFECGYLVVPESRKIKNGNTIRLPIVILKSENPKPKPDPVLRTLGGPGGSSLRLVGGRRFSPWLKDRDMIIFEQRGTKYAQPALACPEVDEANTGSAKKQLDKQTARRNEIRAAKVCYDRLTKQGINLSAYNSAESAADIEDLRRVLKLEKLNLYGLSYSARLMLNVMRDYPKGIRSVVLESTLPPEVNYNEVGVDGIVYALNRLFENCKNEPECAKTFPNIETEFYETVAKLNNEPLTAVVKDEKTGETNEIKLDGNDFATWVVDYMLSNDPPSIAAAPFIINQIFQGKYENFKSYANEKLSPSSYSLGMRFSVWCGEEMPFENKRKIAAQASKYENLKGYEVMALPDICSVWKVEPAKPIENKPVKSDIPTLVLSAEYDAYTLPFWGASTAKNLKNNFHFETPWVGHGPAFNTPCLGKMITEFFDNPNTAPKSECLSEVKKQFKFVTKPPQTK